MGKKGSGFSKELIYYVLNITRQGLAIELEQAKKAFREQGKFPDFVKYFAKFLEDRGFFSETIDPPLDKSKDFWSIDKNKMINHLVCQLDPSISTDPAFAVGVSQPPNPRYSYDLGGSRDSEDNNKELIL